MAKAMTTEQITKAVAAAAKRDSVLFTLCLGYVAKAELQTGKIWDDAEWKFKSAMRQMNQNIATGYSASWTCLRLGIGV
jgi:hypothetical protein